MASIKAFSFCIIIYTIIASCDVIEVSEIPDYPITISPLNLLELDDLNRQYQTENEGLICSTLNEYGYTGFSRILFPNDVNPCSSLVAPKVEISDPQPQLEKAISAILKNQNYTNVLDGNDLIVQELLPLYGCTICEGPETNSVPLEWKITFAPQKIEGMEVVGSEITVFADVFGVNRIWGNWYSDFYAPSLLDVGYLEAENSLIGYQVNLNSITGQDSVFTIAEKDIKRASKFEIIPFKNEFEELELRKSWVVPISFMWHDVSQLIANVDAVDGNILQVRLDVQE